MAKQTFSLTLVTCELDDGWGHAEVMGFPEISVVEATAAKRRTSLRAKAKAVLEDEDFSPALDWHRRCLKTSITTGFAPIEWSPPPRATAWQKPVPSTLPFVGWTEDDKTHHAQVPLLGLRVFAPRPEDLPARIAEHARLLWSLRQEGVTLTELALLARVRTVSVETCELIVDLPTPLQRALVQHASQEPTDGSRQVLPTIADELPPLRTPRPGKSTREPIPPCAYEMEDVLQHLAEALSGPRPRSVLLVGPAGCGKSALVHELARRRRELGFGDTPFWSTNGARLLTGQLGLGMWQERCQRLIREVAQQRAILHLGNLAEWVEIGKVTRGEQSIGDFLRPHLARGDMIAIAECTAEQVSAIERQSPQLPGCFLTLPIAEPDPARTRRILDRVYDERPADPPPSSPSSSTSSSTQRVVTALDRLHQLHLRYATYSANPGRVIRFLRRLLTAPGTDRSWGETEVVAAFARETGLPLSLLDDQVPLDLIAAEQWFSGRVLGQSAAVERVLDVLATIKARLARPRKPLASLLLMGPTGTGKTELAKALAEFLFGDPGRLTRFDLAEFADPLSVQRLIGGPSQGTTEGLLTARVREQPFTVLLLDEFEKADPAFFDLLLQVLGEGRLTDGAGRVADFCNCVIVMTSNLGAQAFQRGPAGFRSTEAMPNVADEHFLGEARRFLRPEMFNRIDAVVPFQPLTAALVRRIAERELTRIQQRDGLQLRPLTFRASPEVIDLLVQRGYDPRYGARPLKRTLERDLLVPLAEALNHHGGDHPVTVEVRVNHNQFVVRVRNHPSTSIATDNLSPDSTASNPAATCRALVEERRKLDRLRFCSKVRDMEDQRDLLEAERRRWMRRTTHPGASPPFAARLAAMNQYLSRLHAAGEQVGRWETEALVAWYQRQPAKPDHRTSVTTCASQRTRLQSDLLRLLTDKPDEIVLALFSDDRPFLINLARAYYRLAASQGTVGPLLTFLPPPGKRDARRQVARMIVASADRFFLQESETVDHGSPAPLLGLAMTLHGDFYGLLFRGENGLHVMVDRESEKVCLVQTAKLPLDNYQPPPGIERPGGFKTTTTARRRVYRPDAKEIEDAIVGRRPWMTGDVHRSLRNLLDEDLQRQIDSVAD